MANVKLDEMMAKIKQMLVLADDPRTPEHEADNARAFAERLMKKYRIEESELIASGALAAEAITPGVKDIPVAPWSNEFYLVYWHLMCYVASHTGCRMAQTSMYLDGVSYLGATLVGYESDLRFAEMLFTNAKIVFAERMEPKPLDGMSDEDNVYRMRSAGMERIRIARLMGFGDTGSATAKVTRLYKAACKARGEDAVLTGRSMSVTLFRETYADGFKNQFWSMLHAARNAADQDGGGALVLADRSDKVDEAFYQHFPHLRPTQAKAIGENVKSKRARQYKATKADMERAMRRASAAGQVGANAGRKAASEVNVGGVKPAKRLGE